MDLNATLLAQLVVFAVLAGFTMKFVWPPLIKALDERAKKIADGLAAAEKGKQALADANKQVDSEIARVRNESQQRLGEAERRAQQIIEQAKAQAEQERQRILSQAEKEAEVEMQRAKDALRSQVGSLVLVGVKQILQKEIDASVHADLLKRLQQQL